MKNAVSKILYAMLGLATALSIAPSSSRADSIPSQAKVQVIISGDEGVEIGSGSRFIISCVNNETNEACNVKLTVEGIDGINYLEFPEIGIYKINDIAFVTNDRPSISTKYAVTEYVNADWDGTEKMYIGVGESECNKLVNDMGNIRVFEKHGSLAHPDDAAADIDAGMGERTDVGKTTQLQSPAALSTDKDTEGIRYIDEVKNKVVNNIVKKFMFGAVVTLIGIVVMLVMKKQGKIK